MKIQHYLNSFQEIYSSIKNRSENTEVKVEDIEFIVLPEVFPSHEFRTTKCLLGSIRKIVKNKKILDMGCGYGLVGIYSLHQGAAQVVQADINPHAVNNSKINKKLHNFSDNQLKIYESDCFESIPKQKFDLIIFNPPFNTKNEEIKDYLKKSLWDPGFQALKSFLKNAKDYIDEGKILICFSGGGDTETLENLFQTYGYNWKLWKIFNQNQKFDNRIYMINK